MDISPLIISTCIGLSGQYNTACNNTLNATAKQSGINRSIDDVQSKLEKYADRWSKNIVGEKSIGYIGGTIWVVKIAEEKKATLNLPKFVLYDSASTELSENSYRLSLQWKF